LKEATIITVKKEQRGRTSVTKTSKTPQNSQTRLRIQLLEHNMTEHRVKPIYIVNAKKNMTRMCLKMFLNVMHREFNTIGGTKLNKEERVEGGIRRRQYREASRMKTSESAMGRTPSFFFLAAIKRQVNNLSRLDGSNWPQAMSWTN